MLLSMKKLLFDRRNYLLLAIALLLIAVGFILMSGGKSPDGVFFNPAIFSVRRIVVAPIVTLVGFLLVVVSIMLPPKKERKEQKQ